MYEHVQIQPHWVMQHNDVVPPNVDRAMHLMGLTRGWAGGDKIVRELACLIAIKSHRPIERAMQDASPLLTE